MSKNASDCVCYIGQDNPDPPRWTKNPDPLGCPIHRPIKRYCRIHHSGFYGSCQACRLDDLCNGFMAEDIQ